VTSILTAPDPAMCRQVRYLELDDFADGLLQLLAREATPAEDAVLLTHLAGVAAQLAEHAEHLFHCTTEAEQIRAAADNAHIVAVIADAAAARAGGRPRTLGLLTALDDHAPAAALLDELAGHDEQTSAQHADRLHRLVDELDELGLDIDLAAAIAHAISRRPGGDL
jgi:hypothetical protein